ncbi:DUF1203 domain-containing protein [Streptomyces sp. H10-C2]|nr:MULTISPECIES: DUF1203 domain-containing protein [unclassified Streptomyces]MDJ0341228.1 DUF1203 domain-containing protein [Streptomyces sp. PH10-H1]MDJ0369419.1 DUF1203 domain-containing protein [Streptomyces sp. H10-C2]
MEPAVLARLREADDAGRAPELSTDEEGGAPLRCCLRPAEPGDRLALLSYAPLRHWAAETGARPGPYLELGPVFVHADAAQCPGPPSGPGYPRTMHGASRVPQLHEGAMQFRSVVDRGGDLEVVRLQHPDQPVAQQEEVFGEDDTHGNSRVAGGGTVTGPRPAVGGALPAQPALMG